jgi:putative transposase
MSSENYLVKNQNAIYFLTFTVVDWVDVFTRKEYKIVVVDSLNYCVQNKGLEIFSWCLMSNHLHLVCRAKDGFRLTDIVRDFKKFTAKAILDKIKNEPESRQDWMLYRFEFAGKFDRRVSTYRFWQDTSHAIELESNEMVEQRINYVHDNPIRAMIVNQPEYYLFSSACDYAGEKGLVMISSDL